MTQAKTSTIFNIIGNGMKLYLQNVFTLTNPVVLPVLGMFVGILLMIIPVYLLPKVYPALAESVPIFRELFATFTVVILTILPGLIIFKIAFWNYMLKMVSLNNIIVDILKRKVVKPHQHYTQVVALRSKDYLLMLGIWCSIIIMGLALPVAVFLFDIDPLFTPYLLIGFEFLAIFLLIILSFYLSLCFQVFAFETSFGPMQSLEESFKLVLNNFWRIVTLAFALTVITSVAIPQILLFIADIFMVKGILALPFQVLLENIFESYDTLYATLQNFPVFPYESQPKFILEMSKYLTSSMISGIISLLMMPLGACFYTLFYIDAKKRLPVKVETEKEENGAVKKLKSKKTIQK